MPGCSEECLGSREAGKYHHLECGYLQVEEGGSRLEQCGKWKWEVISVLRLLGTGDIDYIKEIFSSDQELKKC